MGLIKFNGTTDYLKWATLASALQNTPTAAWTMLFGIKHRVLTSKYQAYGYLLSSTGNGAVQMGLSVEPTTNDPVSDLVSSPFKFTNLDPVAGEDTLYVVSKATGSSIASASKKVGPTGSWATQAANVAKGNASAAAQLQLGTWQLTDMLDGWEAVVAIWNVALTQTQREACGANWKTSDIYAAHPTKPLLLLEMNVPKAALINIGTAAISTPTSVGTTLDTAETFGDWNFDGYGAEFLNFM